MERESGFFAGRFADNMLEWQTGGIAIRRETR
jgi:hypothetical protein